MQYLLIVNSCFFKLPAFIPPLRFLKRGELLPWEEEDGYKGSLRSSKHKVRQRLRNLMARHVPGFTSRWEGAIKSTWPHYQENWWWGWEARSTSLCLQGNDGWVQDSGTTRALCKSQRSRKFQKREREGDTNVLAAVPHRPTKKPAYCRGRTPRPAVRVGACRCVRVRGCAWPCAAVRGRVWRGAAWEHHSTGPSRRVRRNPGGYTLLLGGPGGGGRRPTWWVSPARPQ